MAQAKAETKYQQPDANGHFGQYGGRFVAETLMEPLTELRLAYEKYMVDK
ncbi:MAG: tryptophan synthase subunit beta, partial [Gammaproteobacteria bacterium]|nr:tryptophan synthase subunit beta [Gammaproteobacteria bacterium]